ncbi:MAG: methionyl-tRNA formyltransferase [Deltaproteobacteria bacterium RIFCSPHIGHO2_12_FULL_43_9]|nr:MAG: methionyl-tRNA formyltransferase [Deltaproteobacteria bacterium RIFCSPHIGHO2_12_FULL_43_9]
MKIIFMGTPEFAAISLRELIAGEDEIVAIFTQPDKPKGRGKPVSSSPVKLIAEEMKIPLFTPLSLKGDDVFNTIKNYDHELIIVVAYGQIIPGNILNLPKYGCINAHASLLPQYRGAAPIQRAIMQGAEETGISIIKLIEELDAGPIILQEKVKIEENETYGSLHDRLAKLAAKCLIEACSLIRNNKFNLEKQDEKFATYAYKLKSEEEVIEWSATAKCIHDHIQALDPAPGAFSTIRGHRIKIFSSRLIKSCGTGTPGNIIDIKKDGILIQAGEGIIKIAEVQPANKKRMSAVEFVNGARISKGHRFGD